jgi:hypothetical protein
MACAVIFYVGLFMALGYGAWYGFIAPRHQMNQSREAQTAALKHPGDRASVFVGLAGALIGLLVVVFLAWCGAQFGRGNAWFDRRLRRLSRYEQSSGIAKQSDGRRITVDGKRRHQDPRFLFQDIDVKMGRMFNHTKELSPTATHMTTYHRRDSSALSVASLAGRGAGLSGRG